MLVFACPPGFAASLPAGMSAPKAPASSIESAPADKLIQSPFDWHGLALTPAGISLARGDIQTQHDPAPTPNAAGPHYGPLYRRPPPRFS